MERPHSPEAPPPPRVELPPEAPRAPNPLRILAGALAVIALVLLVPLVVTAWLWSVLWSFGVDAPLLPTLFAVTSTVLVYVLHIAVLSRAVRPLTRV